MKLIVVLSALVAVVSQASANEMMSEVELATFGIENCPNKCEKVFDRTQYAITDQVGADTFEYRSCIIGCNMCQTILNKNSTDTCFKSCKTLNYGKRGIRKGVIEPDKACIMGCMINTCQSICTGGTTDRLVTPQNQQSWWGLGGNGCSIKGGLGYVQNPDYVNPNAPVGQGGSDAQRQCCAQALNLCQYVGPTDSTNYANVVLVTQRKCKDLVGSTDIDAICAYEANAQNCGTRGMSA